MFVTSLSNAKPQAARAPGRPHRAAGEGGKFSGAAAAQREFKGHPRAAGGKREGQRGGKDGPKQLSREDAAEQAAQAHPSWAAARAARDQPTIAKFEGKKVTFDSDSD